MVTDGKWKYIYSEANATEELYDQENDIQELHNLAHASECVERINVIRNLLRECALEFNDDNLFDGDNFAGSSVDRSKFSNAPVGGMGWRWY